jgi:hypothetical protein
MLKEVSGDRWAGSRSAVPRFVAERQHQPHVRCGTAVRMHTGALPRNDQQRSVDSSMAMTAPAAR